MACAPQHEWHVNRSFTSLVGGCHCPKLQGAALTRLGGEVFCAICSASAIAPGSHTPTAPLCTTNPEVSGHGTFALSSSPDVPSHLPGLHRFLPLSAPTGRVESSGSAVHVVTPCRRLPTPWWCGHDALTSDLSSARRSVCMGSKEQMQMRACGHPPRCPHFFPSGLPSL